MNSRAKGGILAFVGFLLSPLSWWNDLIINIPLAYFFAIPFGFVSKQFFLPALIIGYWLTNVLGFVLLHHGVNGVISSSKKKYTRNDLLKDVAFSLGYTILIAVLVLAGWLKFPTEYFN